MTAEQLSLFCPFGGCGPYGYCPCAEPYAESEDDWDDEFDPDESEFLKLPPGAELIRHRGRLRVVETLPPLDTYQP